MARHTLIKATWKLLIGFASIAMSFPLLASTKHLMHEVAGPNGTEWQSHIDLAIGAAVLMTCFGFGCIYGLFSIFGSVRLFLLATDQRKTSKN